MSACSTLYNKRRIPHSRWADPERRNTQRPKRPEMPWFIRPVRTWISEKEAIPRIGWVGCPPVHMRRARTTRQRHALKRQCPEKALPWLLLGSRTVCLCQELHQLSPCCTQRLYKFTMLGRSSTRTCLHPRGRTPTNAALVGAPSAPLTSQNAMDSGKETFAT